MATQRYFQVFLDDIPVQIDDSVTLTYTNAGQVLQVPLLGAQRYLQNLGPALLETTFTILLNYTDVQEFDAKFKPLLPYLKANKTFTLTHPYLGRLYGVIKADISLDLQFSEYGISRIPCTFYELTDKKKAPTQSQITLSNYVYNNAKPAVVTSTQNQLTKVAATRPVVQNSVRSKVMLYQFNFFSGVQNFNRVARMVTKGLSTLSTILNTPALIVNTSRTGRAQLSGRFKSLTSSFRKAQTQPANTNLVQPQSHVPTTANYLEAIYDTPNQEVLNVPGLTEDQQNAYRLSQQQELMRQLLKTFTEALQAGLDEFRQAKVEYNLAADSQNIYSPSIQPTVVIIQSSMVNIEFLYLYNALSFLQLYEDYEFSSTQEAIEFLQSLNTMVQYLLQLQYTELDIVLQTLKGIVGIRNEVLSQISELSQTYLVETNGQSVRSLVYKMSGSLDSLEATYDSIRVFDMGDVTGLLPIEV